EVGEQRPGLLFTVRVAGWRAGDRSAHGRNLLELRGHDDRMSSFRDTVGPPVNQGQYRAAVWVGDFPHDQGNSGIPDELSASLLGPVSRVRLPARRRDGRPPRRRLALVVYECQARQPDESYQRDGTVIAWRSMIASSRCCA